MEFIPTLYYYIVYCVASSKGKLIFEILLRLKKILLISLLTGVSNVRLLPALVMYTYITVTVKAGIKLVLLMCITFSTNLVKSTI